MKRSFTLFILFLTLTTVSAQWVATVAGVLETPGFNDGAALSSRFFNPHGVAIDSNGIVYVADRFNHTIRKFDPATGTVTTVAGKAGQKGTEDGQGNAARFNEPWGICVSPGGTMYVADTKNNKIRKVTPEGMVTSIAGSGNFGTSNGQGASATFGNPTGIERDDAGNLYVADHLTHIIRKISPSGNVSTIAGFPYIPGNLDGTGDEAQFWRPYGLTLDNEGNILVADEWNHSIRRVSPGGTVTTVAGTGTIGLINGSATGARFNYPWDITVDPQGNIYVTDGYNYVIRKITPSGTVSSLAGKPQTPGGTDGEANIATFSGATSVAWCHKTGKIYVGDAYNHLIRTILFDGEPQPELNLLNINGLNNICEDDELTVEAIQAQYNNYRFFLDGSLVQNNGSRTYVAAGLSVGPHEIYLETDFEGDVLVSNTVSFTVLELPQPSISAVGPLNIYDGETVTLLATATGSLLWSNGASTQTITVSESGTYFVEETINGCTGISNELVVDVTVLPNQAAITLQGGAKLCPGKTTTLVSSAAAGNQWLKDGWPIAGQTGTTLAVTEAGIYQVQVTDPTTGVTVISNEQAITTVPDPNWSIEASPRQGRPGQEVSFWVVGNEQPAQYRWDFGEAGTSSELSAPKYTYLTAGSYTVSLAATDQHGCEYTISRNNYILISENSNPAPSPSPNGQFLPTAFTPNGDGVNDQFRVRGNITGDFSMTIFNQWGEAIYQSQNPAEGWDGTRNGLLVQNGTYVYLVNLETPEGKQQLSGHVTLLR